MMAIRMRAAAGAAIALAAVMPVPAAAQMSPAEVGAFNVAGSALIGGISRVLDGGSFLDGFRRGAEAGAVIFTGKLIAARSRTPVSPAAGRLVGQVGASMLRNAMAGEDRFGRLTFLVGPVTLDVGDGVRVRPDIGVLNRVVDRVLDDDYTFDAAGSLRFLAPAFTRHDAGPRLLGSTSRGTISVGAGARDAGALSEEVFAHETVHLIQQDMNAIVFVQPLLDRALGDPPVTWNTGNKVLRPLEYLTCGTQCWTETEAHALAQGEPWPRKLYDPASLF